ncbi:MAG: hypothetical protein NPIRA04_34200 [Nitrospirales bacterium]|nr:MAG: hypothetical protein NPIRA04_34200 [Nitrospirales bacterium]
MKCVTIYRTCILLMTFGLAVAISACGNSDSTSDNPSVGEQKTSTAAPPVVEQETPPTMPSVSEEVTPSTSSSVVEETTMQGELLKIEEDMYVIKDRAGAEQHFNARPDTLVDEGMSTGDRVIIKINADGEAIAIRKER